MKLTKRLLALLLTLATLLMALPVTALAAEEGTATSNAVYATFGKQYYKAWTEGTYHTDYYVKISVPQRGIVTIKTTKPVDSQGKYISLKFTLYNKSGEDIWGNKTFHAKNDEKNYYQVSVGLNPGTYYLTIQPDIYVRSGSIGTNYTISLKTSAYCEVEPNNSLSEATSMALGKTYIGYFGRDGLGTSEEYDCYKINLKAKETYAISVGNMASFGTTLLQMTDPLGNQQEIKWALLQNKADTKGNHCLYYTALSTGTYYFRIWNYNQSQYTYTLNVTKTTTARSGLSTPQITAIENVAKGVSGIKMNWGKVSGATKYEVYRRKHGASGWTKIATVTSPTYTDTSVRWMTGTLYDYSVVAVSSSARSAVAPTKTILRMAAPAITGLTNSASKTVKATWSQNKSADGYQIWYQVGENASSRKIVTVYGSGTLSRTISGLTKGNRYKVFVRSFKKVNGVYYYSAWSASRTVKVSK